ncbi:DUF3224 family protein [Kribbella antibiotica]|uniref:DUF3224 family protein n=1 Tax=Kribbella antibiotica TaxID=190195 RepID=A0A4R4ZD55_9ACTN|nr:DUF3224 domain-containing protein [Kribbella antibiotica]TDD56353.1 DUF3224 family protein [Kribbella antibiotica]
MPETAAAFTIDLKPADPLLEATGRFDFTKDWTGGMTGTSTGLMLSAGDPSTGRAGYVALETFQGEIDGRAGTAVLQQFGTMTDETTLYYEFVPGSGTGELQGIKGKLKLDGHDVEVSYQL